MSKRKLTRRAALACLGSGAVATLFGSGAFTTVDAERQVSVDIAADDGTALLGLSQPSGPTAVSDVDDSAVLFEVTDNIGGLSTADISVTVVSVTRQDGTAVQNPPVSVTVREAGSDRFDVELGCSAETDSLGETYQVTLEITVASSDVTVTAERTRSDVPVSCESGKVVLDGGNSGSTDTDKDVEVTEKTGVTGSITSGGSVDVRQKGYVSGAIDAADGVTLDDKSTADDQITAGGSVIVGGKGYVQGAIDSGGDITLDDKATADDQITASGNVTVGKKGYVRGAIDAVGNVTLKSGADTDGRITADGTVTVTDGYVGGSICAAGDVTLEEGTYVDGSVKSTGGSVTLGNEVGVNDTVVASDRVDNNGSNVPEDRITRNVPDVQCD